MGRHDILPRSLWAGLGLSLLLALPAAAAERPHIVLILADDLGWNDVSYHGSEIRTPHIDALAERGVVLDRFYAFPTCSPTRVALMTGRSPLVLGLHGPLEPERRGLPAGERLLPEILRDAGYQTLLTGKWHLGSGTTSEWPNQRGFDHAYGNLTGGIGYWDKVHRGGYDWQRNGEVVREDGYVTELIVDEAVRLLRRRDRERPVFLYVAFTAPHVPNEAPEAALALYAGIEDPHRRTHAGMVHALDLAMGRLFAALDAEGMANDTLVIFLSDNGGANREFVRPWVRFVVPHFDTWASDNTPLRGAKTTVFEGGIRVPAILHWPGRLEGGREVAGRVTAQDLLPTLAEALALSLEGTRALHGTSRWDVIAQGAGTPAPDFVVGNIGSFAYFRGPWKLVEARSALPFAQPSGTWLFDVERDPGERRDLAAEHPEVLAELQRALAAFPTTESDFPVPRPWEFDTLFGGEETREPWADTAARD
jgi:arylsulfatase A-like enzyme